MVRPQPRPFHLSFRQQSGELDKQAIEFFGFILAQHGIAMDSLA
jgi:hypothetical protein